MSNSIFKNMPKVIFGGRGGAAAPARMMMEVAVDERELRKRTSTTSSSGTITVASLTYHSNPGGEDDDEDEEDEEDEDGSTNEDKDDYPEQYHLEGVYDPSKYESLEVPSDIKNLFTFITYYTPQMIEITPKLKPFVPEYIPAVGDVDAFIKIPAPDGRENQLGLTVLDEPSVQQSDPALLQLKLKAISKDLKPSSSGVGGSSSSGAVGSQDDQGSTISAMSDDITLVRSRGTAKEIDTWIENIKHLHETTARPDSVTLMHNHHKFDIEELMQEWPEEIETALSVHTIPPPDLDCSLEEYINIICGILDIPVQSNKIASLHLLFSLYNEFQNSQHFKKYSN